MPGADYQLTKLLGHRPFVKRHMMYQHGCFASGTILHLAKDLADNNRGARVIVVCSEITVVTFRGPSEAHLDSLVGQALFGDGAAAIIVGADPDTQVERPIFELVLAAQTILPDSDSAIDGHLEEVGLTFHLLKDVPGLILKKIEKSLTEAFTPLNIIDGIQAEDSSRRRKWSSEDRRRDSDGGGMVSGGGGAGEEVLENECGVREVMEVGGGGGQQEFHVIVSEL